MLGGSLQSRSPPSLILGDSASSLRKTNVRLRHSNLPSSTRKNRRSNSSMATLRCAPVDFTDVESIDRPSGKTRGQENVSPGRRDEGKGHEQRTEDWELVHHHGHHHLRLDPRTIGSPPHAAVVPLFLPAPPPRLEREIWDRL